MEALTIKKLRKTYEGKLEALKGIDLNVEEGDFFALLGPNGAGKTTTIGIISSLINKTSGQVKILSTFIFITSYTSLFGKIIEEDKMKEL